MSFLKSVKYLLFLLVFQSTCYGQKPGLQQINVDELKRHLTFLSSDSLQGRAFGTPIKGLDIAASYLKTNAKNIGLKSRR